MGDAARSAAREGAVVVRSIVIGRAFQRASTVALLVILSCASPGAPPGGPEDHESPKLLKISPDSNATGVKPKVVVFQFDEVINERSAATGGGFGGASGDYAAGGGGGGSSRSASSLTGIFLISPIAGDIDVSWHRSRIEVRPRKGWRANTTYVVRMLPGIADLRSNRDSIGRTFVFSTGKEIALGKIAGIAFDWLSAKPANGAWVEARPANDTTLAYVSVADSIGKFAIPHVPPGTYKLRAIIDQNHNRAIDPREAYDSATVVLQDSVSREMLAFPHDTIGAGLATVEPKDSVTLRVQFDRAVDVNQRLTVASFTLKAHDSTVVPITSVLTAVESARQDSIRAAAVADSARRVEQAKRDSVQKADSAKAAAAPKRPAPQVPTRRPQAPTRADTAKKQEPPPKPSKPSPGTEYVIKVATPLKPGTSYRLHADSVRNLLGRARTSERQFTTPKPAPPSDSTKAKRPTNARADTTRGRRPAVRPTTPATPVRSDSTRRDSTRRDSTRRDSTARRDSTVRPDTSVRRDSTRRDTSATRRDTLGIRREE